MLRILSISVHTPVADVELEGTGEALRSPSRRPGRPVGVSRHRKRDDICMYIYLRDVGSDITVGRIVRDAHAI